MTKFWEIKNSISGENEILLYGPIASEKSWFGDEATPKEFKQDLEALNGAAVTVRINSGGGDVFAAHAIHNLLMSYKGRVTVCIDGLAASAATIVAMAGDKIIMPANALFMIHNPMIGVSEYCNAEDLRAMAEALVKVKDSIVASYTKRCKVSKAELEAMMDAETWMGADECLEKGFITDIEGQANVALNKNILTVNTVDYDTKQFKNLNGIKNHLAQRAESEGDPNMSKVNVSAVEAFLNLFMSGNKEQAPAPANVTASNPVNTVTASGAEAAQAAIDAAVQAERERLVALDALNADGNAHVQAIINAAKSSGKSVADVQPYIDAIKNVAPAVNEDAQQLVANLVNDNQESGVGGIGAAPQVSDAETEKMADAKVLQAMGAAMNNKFGGKNNG